MNSKLLLCAVCCLLCPAAALALLIAVSPAHATPGIHGAQAEARRPIEQVGRPQPGSTWGPLIPCDDPVLSHRVYGYSPYWADMRWLRYDLLTHIGLFDVTLEPDGRISNYSGFPGHWADVIARAHRNGVKCELVATCFGWWNIHQAITVGADSAIRNLVALADSTGMDGINMDFEEILGSDRDTMVRFMQRLSAACRARGLELTMATMPLDFLNAYDFAALADTTDGLFIMGYNYHWPGCPEAGPCAPLFGWEFYGNLQMTIDEYLTEIGSAEKLYFGLPYYGYEWPTLAETLHSRTTGVATDLYYRDARPNAQQRGRRWDNESQTPWYAYNDGQWHQGWYDNDSSLMLKYQEVHEHEFLGTGIWALGYDGARRELWAALRESFSRPLAQFVNGDCETWRLDTAIAPADTSPNPPGWYEDRRASYRRETQLKRSGSSSIALAPDNLGDTGRVCGQVFQDVDVEPGTVWEFSGWAWKNDGIGNRLRLELEWYDARHRSVGRASSAELTRDSTAWRLLTTGLQPAPGSAASARLKLVVEGTGGEDFWDDIAFQPVTAVAELPQPQASSCRQHATLVRGMLMLPQSARDKRRVTSWLLDISGRKVTNLRPGVNDVSCLAPGVYFVTEQIRLSPDARPASKVVIW